MLLLLPPCAAANTHERTFHLLLHSEVRTTESPTKRKKFNKWELKTKTKNHRKEEEEERVVIIYRMFRAAVAAAFFAHYSLRCDIGCVCVSLFFRVQFFVVLFFHSKNGAVVRNTHTSSFAISSFCARLLCRRSFFRFVLFFVPIFPLFFFG